MTEIRPTTLDALVDRPLRTLGDVITLKAASPTGRFALFDLLAEAAAPPLHTHPWEETFHVLEGALRLQIGDRVTTLGPGETATMPADVPHTYRAAPRARVVVVLSSVAAADFFAEIDGLADIGAVVAVAARHGVVPCGPPLPA